MIVCSVDVNGLTDLSFARIWSSPSHFGERATFLTKDRLTSLLIVNNIRGNESGLYRWVGREGMMRSPTFNTLILPSDAELTSKTRPLVTASSTWISLVRRS